MKEYTVDGHAPSLLPDGYDFELVWSDEFDGTELDRTKWDYRMHMMNRRHYAWSDKGVELDGKGNAVFRIFEEDGHIDKYVSHIPEFILITTEVNGYGKEGKNYRPEALDTARAGDTFLVDYVRVFDIKK